VGRAARTHRGFGIEGTGSYGVGLTGAVRRAGHRVVEVNRGDRRSRRAQGKSDTVDAEAAARAVLNGQATTIPKTATGSAEMMRQLKIARDTAVKAKTAAIITLKQIIVNAPVDLREELALLGDKALITRCAGFRRTEPLDSTTTSAKHTLRALARRWLSRTLQHIRGISTERCPVVDDHAARPFRVGPSSKRPVRS
jgi:transposase